MKPESLGNMKHSLSRSSRVRHRRLAFAAALVAGALALTGCAADAGADDEQQELIPITIGIGTNLITPTQGLSLYLPLALGYWEDEGYDVTVQTFDGTTAAVQAMLAGQLDLMPNTGTATVATAIEAGLDITCVATITNGPYLKVLRMPDTEGIDSIDDLAGKKVGVSSLSSTHYQWTVAALTDAGIAPTDVEFVAIGAGVEAAVALQQGHVDVQVTDDSGGLITESTVGAEYVSAPYFDDLYFNACTAVPGGSLDDEAKTAAMIAITKGVAQATVFAEENPEAAVRAFWEELPEAQPTGDFDQALSDAIDQMVIRLGATMPEKDKEWGLSTPAQVTSQLDALLTGGAVTKPVDSDKIYTDEYIEAINDFDWDAIREEARNWKPAE